MSNKFVIEVKKILLIIWRFIRGIIYATGIFFILLVALSFTDYPYNAYHWLGTSLTHPQVENVDYIILLGAGGMPGPDALLRTHHTSRIAKKYSSSKIIVALPADTNDFYNSDHYRMIEELQRLGIDPERIMSETQGVNTFQQSQFIFNLISRNKASIIIVTSPEHVFRSILTFKKTGFYQINGDPSFESPIEQKLLVDNQQSDTNKQTAADNLNIRYNMWSNLQYEIKVLREFAAIIYYKIKGYL